MCEHHKKKPSRSEKGKGVKQKENQVKKQENKERRTRREE